jgi:abortive infection bacteriophage resistance protein
MGAIANNIKDQIEKLSSRGMELDFEEAKIKEILLDVGYYRLGFYWNPFEKNKNHEFIENTKFSDAVCLYYLDVDLRNLLLQYINRIEINFRTKVVYYISNKYKQSPTWFIDPKVISSDFINSIGDHYNADFKKNHKPIRIHHQNNINDKYAPAWKTLEFFTFGAILKVFKSIVDTEIKERISKEYGIQNLGKFVNLMETIVYVRNTCAHGGVIFDLMTPKGIASLPMVTFNDNNRHSLDSAIKIIQLILSAVSTSRKDDMEDAIQALFAKHAHNGCIKDIIEQKIGYVY